MSNLKLLIKERLDELSQSTHSVDRLKQRLYGIKDEVNPNHFGIIIQSLDQLRGIDFPEQKSYAVCLGPIMAKDRDNRNLVNVDGRVYYRVMTDGMLKDSTGNQFWVIIRNNTITTAMLRKDIQTRDRERNKGKLNVDMVFHRVSHIKKI